MYCLFLSTSARVAASSCLLLAVLISPAMAQWSGDPTISTPICTGNGYELTPAMIADGVGGAIIVWKDGRNSIDWDIYAQRVNASGYVQWTINGIAVSAASSDQSDPVVVPDDSGGIIVVWEDSRNGVNNIDVYAQRVDGSGVVKWNTNDVAVCTFANNQVDPAILSDGAGGIIVVWTDKRTGTDDVYAQRIDATGTPRWTTDGVAISAVAGPQQSPVVASDSAGGAIFAWFDYRNSISEIYAQRIDTTGTIHWTSGGLAVALGTAPAIASDNAGGAFITWGGTDLYCQRINAAGTTQWAGNGVPISTATGDQSKAFIIPDGSGGAIIAWEDHGNGSSDFNIRAQRITGGGIVQWAVNGAGVCTAQGEQTWPRAISDGSGGAIFVWQDNRFASYGDIFAERFDGNGTRQWSGDGVPIATIIGAQSLPAIASDGMGGAIVAWEDYRVIPGGSYDIHAQHVDANGALPVQLAFFSAAYVSSNIVRLNWTTISEINNYGFYIQRKAENETRWTELQGSFVAGHGTTTEPQHYSYTDNSALLSSLQYRLKQVDLDGSIHYTDPVHVSYTTSVGDDVPRTLSLSQNYPNPFNPTTTIRFSVETTYHARLDVYSTLGQLVAILFDGKAEAGRFYEVQLSGESLPSGVYLCRLQSGGRVDSKKLILLK